MTPPVTYPRITEDKGQGVTAGAAALAAGIVGVAAGAAAVVASRLGKPSDAPTKAGKLAP